VFGWRMRQRRDGSTAFDEPGFMIYVMVRDAACSASILDS
jgi:hypothetical protein